MPLYQKRPVVVQAMQFTGAGLQNLQYQQDFDEWLVSNQGSRKVRYVGNSLVIPTLEGDMVASPGDWIICGVEGEIYPCKPDIFAKTYELVL